MNRRRPLALLGGTFDPVHAAHLQLARRALRDLPIGGVCLIPNGQPPHRAMPQLSWQQRVGTCKQALSGITRVSVGLDEPPGTSRWTIDTVRRRRRRGAVVLIVGADAFADFNRWRHWRRILQLANIAVARRGGKHPKIRHGHCHIIKNPQRLAAGVGRVFLWPFCPANISSTQIRQPSPKGAA